MENEFPKAYVAGEHEARIYEMWESSGAFKPQGTGKPWSLVMPPFNANGNLHMGHALVCTLEDIMARYHRMKGDRTLMVMGTDHAGFETQIVFEKKLEKEGRSRFQMTQEQFREETLAFTLANKENIENQVRMMGTSADWDANRFTLDPLVVDRVYRTFRKMYQEGLIYRGERIVNYSVKYRTAYSDIEVLHEDRVDPLYYIKYGPITIATVRPETKFGDKTIVVHPEDERYKEFVGKSYPVQIATGETITMTVIADEAIKPEFGTGAMTITPAHDPIDFEIAQRHNLPITPVIGMDGKLLAIAGEFAGIKAAEARKLIAARLQELGLIEKVDENYRHSVALCYKSLQPIEPMVMPQWYVKVRPLADRAIEAIEKGEVTYYPEGYKKIQLDWLRGLRDWNISRQIWWGIPIAGAMPDVPEIANDPDTFDTWFSSAQWPVAVLEAMGEEYLEDFYPTTVMETGRDLIFSWVTRMLMMGLYLRDQVPFKNVYFHGMVNDAQGKKMSKSKGNVVSPVELAAKYGVDALRFGLVVGSAAAGDLPLPEEKMIGGRNFANKLWNMARFVLMQMDGRLPSDLPRATMTKYEDAHELSLNADTQVTGSITEADKDITIAYLNAKEEIAAHLDSYRFAQAIQALHEFAWHEFADVYVEAAKNQKDENGRVTDKTCAVLFEVLTGTLKLAHPFMPFVTEAIWQQLPEREGMLISERL
ncbi:MAG TPA: valine--tRNA ligase [Verrucomicrobiae bacterium]|nr:valine--tRNA ligase [Verrucomicrobiae bacterium]